MREQILSVMEQHNAQAILVSDGFNMRHISGFTGATGYLFLSKERFVLLTDSRYTTQAKREAKEFEVIEINNEKPYRVWIKELTEQAKVQRLMFENLHIGFEDYRVLKEAVGEGVEWVLTGESLNALRIVKTAEEIGYMEQAAAIADQAFLHILDFIKPGVTELQVAAELEYAMKRQGATNVSFDTIVASGKNSALPHATPSDKKIVNGDFVTMDYGCLINGYCSDMTRTVMVGKANEEQKKVYHTVLEAHDAAEAVLKAGMRGCDVDKVARDYIKTAGYGEYFGHGLGHSVGLFIHEEPRLSPLDSTVLQENVIETVEPGIYIPDFGGVRIEDMVVVTKEGFKSLSNSERKLIEL